MSSRAQADMPSLIGSEHWRRPSSSVRKSTVAETVPLRRNGPSSRSWSDGGWRVVYERLRFAGLAGDREADVRRITEQTTLWLEGKIRERPELWMWIHRRWKTEPPDYP